MFYKTYFGHGFFSLVDLTSIKAIKRHEKLIKVKENSMQITNLIIIFSF